ncbi:hypothetical protein FHQ28_05365 [Pasteurellaceae bacterium USgator11]|nr:hypothetical protein FHQ19_09435 [Pasteurellaceae bacterium UScroc12]TNG94744.1 hypothetical protein FHQ20_08105 [Pasteurellaceae bacterium USgator41]TNG97715.1 hypothetical protein FHQ24_09895 [Pasteurellaceae bacterium UScroc31]TNH01676.1 hypothetical protein FHQ28_05365 [Pasteurellaceae bacterium USgator11]
MSYMTVKIDDLNDIVIYAVRYTLGRKSYAPEDVRRFIRKYQAELLSSVIECICCDIRYLLDRHYDRLQDSDYRETHQRFGGLLGGETELLKWKALYEELSYREYKEPQLD